MAHKTFTQRVIYQAKCPCGQMDIQYTENPPREVQCPSCKKWIEPTEIQWVGPDQFNKNDSKRH